MTSTRKWHNQTQNNPISEIQWCVNARIFRFSQRIDPALVKTWDARQTAKSLLNACEHHENCHLTSKETSPYCSPTGEIDWKIRFFLIRGWSYAVVMFAPELRWSLMSLAVLHSLSIMNDRYGARGLLRNEMRDQSNEGQKKWTTHPLSIAVWNKSIRVVKGSYSRYYFGPR